MSGVVNPGGQLEVTGGSSGTAPVSIKDGVNDTIAATVFDRPNSNPLAVELVDANGDPVSGSAVSIADGANVVEGAVADVAVTGDNAGTISAKLRGLSKILFSVWDSVASRLKVALDSTFDDSTTSFTFNSVSSPVTIATPRGGTLILTISGGPTGNLGFSEVLGAATMPAIAYVTYNPSNPLQKWEMFLGQCGFNLGNPLNLVITCRGTSVTLSSTISSGTANIVAVYKPGLNITTIPTVIQGAVSTNAADVNGVNQLLVSLVPVGNQQSSIANGLDGNAVGNTSPVVDSVQLLFNGVSYDRWRGDLTNGAFVNVKTSVLPTGAATETGNLAAIKADVDKIPSQGQALAANSVPVVLTAIQAAALTPPAAITGFNLEATQLSVKAKTDNLDVALSTLLKPADTLTKVSTVDTITNPVAVTNANLDVALSTRTKPSDQQHAIIDSSALPANAATETGNLAAIKLDVDKIPSQGQALAAASMPVVLTAIQLAALAPPGMVSQSITINALGSSTLFIITAGTQSVGFVLQVGTLDGTIQFQQTVDGVNWTTLIAAMHSGVGLQQGINFVYTNPNPTNIFSFLLGPGALAVRATCTIFNSGSVVGTFTSSPVISPYPLSPFTGVSGQSLPVYAGVVAGKDGLSLVRTLSVDSNGAITTPPGTIGSDQMNIVLREQRELQEEEVLRTSDSLSYQYAYRGIGKLVTSDRRGSFARGTTR